MKICPIHTEADYQAVMREVSVSEYFDNEPEPDSRAGNRFEIFLTLVAAYKAKNFSIDLPLYPNLSSLRAAALQRCII